MLNAVHVRGNSRKESHDIQNKLIIFVKHGYNLYSWSQHEDVKVENPELYFIAKTNGGDLHPKDDT